MVKVRILSYDAFNGASRWRAFCENSKPLKPFSVNAMLILSNPKELPGADAWAGKLVFANSLLLVYC